MTIYGQSRCTRSEEPRLLPPDKLIRLKRDEPAKQEKENWNFDTDFVTPTQRVDRFYAFGQQ